MKCKNDFSDIKWEKGKTYLGIDKHHNPPEFISDFFNEEWSGEFYHLCRKCHRELHDDILIILNKNSNSSKFIKSEHWIMQKMTPKSILKSKREIYNYTLNWIKKEDDTQTIT